MMADSTSYRLGIDVGGTFTDFVLVDQDGQVTESKTPSTPDEPGEAIEIGLNDLAEKVSISVSDLLANCHLLIHGTTVAINTVLERKGGRTALVVTSGFRDVLQIGRQDRPHLYDWRVRRPEPLVPRHLRFEVRERRAGSEDIVCIKH